MQNKVIIGITIGIALIILILVAYIVWKCRTKNKEDESKSSLITNINENIQMHRLIRNNSTASNNSDEIESASDNNYYVEPPQPNITSAIYYRFSRWTEETFDIRLPRI